jgi:transcriptional regulator with XRE-family HTH domain
MAQKRSSESASEVVRRRLTTIRDWQAQGLSQREIAERLGMAKSTYQNALKGVEAEKIQASDTLQDNEGIPETQALAKVYEGIHISTSDTRLALPEEFSRLLPALQELQDILPVLKIMAKQWSEQQSLLQIPDEYKKYSATYSVRLNERLIDAIKQYADEHRLSQSTVITLAMQQLLNRK